MRNEAKSLIVIAIILVVMGLAFGLPKTKYKSTDILKELTIPYNAGLWRGEDVKNNIKLMDKSYNFVNAIFLRKYVHPSGRVVYLYLLDAGNFHNPKVCMAGAGYSVRDLSDIDYQLPVSQGFSAPAALFNMGKEGSVISYWIIINGQRVGWMQQKVIELWSSLIGLRKSGLMVRMDIPVGNRDTESAVAVAKDFAASLNAALNDKDRQYIYGRP